MPAAPPMPAAPAMPATARSVPTMGTSASQAALKVLIKDEQVGLRLFQLLLLLTTQLHGRTQPTSRNGGWV